MTATAFSPATCSTDQLDSLGEERDRNDSDAIFEMFQALQPLSSPSALKVKNRVLREAIQKIWQEPRMPRGKKRAFSHNKPLNYPWSPKARDLYFAHKADPTVTIKGMLDLEHVTPIGTLTANMEARFAAGDYNADEFFDLLQEVHRPFCFAVLTAKEHRGMGSKLKAAIIPEGTSLWARYEVAFGLLEKDFTSITADPRYAALAAERG